MLCCDHMRSRCWAIPFLLLIAAGPATQPSTAPAVRDFVSGEFRFHLQYPADWIVPPEPVHDQVFSVRTPVSPSGKFGEVGLRIDSGPVDMVDKAALIDLSGSVVGIVQHNGGKNVRITRGQLGGYPSRTVRFQTEGTEAMYVMTVHQHIQYVFNVAAPEEKFEAFLPSVEALLKSFELIE